MSMRAHVAGVRGSLIRQLKPSNDGNVKTGDGGRHEKARHAGGMRALTLGQQAVAGEFLAARGEPHYRLQAA